MLSSRSSLLDSVEAILAPEIGSSIARAAVSMYLEKVGISQEQVEPRHMAGLAQTVKPGLRTFVGGVRADALAARIAALGQRAAARG